MVFLEEAAVEKIKAMVKEPEDANMESIPEGQAHSKD